MYTFKKFGQEAALVKLGLRRPPSMSHRTQDSLQDPYVSEEVRSALLKAHLAALGDSQIAPVEAYAQAGAQSGQSAGHFIGAPVGAFGGGMLGRAAMPKNLLGVLGGAALGGG